MIPRKLIALSLVAVLALFAGIQNVSSSRAQGSLLDLNTPLGVNTPAGTSFTYQGVLTNSNDNPISGSCDFHFSLYDAEASGAQVGTTQEKTAVTLEKGSFTVVLDFGSAAFVGDARWLEVAVRCPAGSGEYTTLSPRQALTAAPYATYAQTVGSHSHWGNTWNGTGTGLRLSGGEIGLDGRGSLFGVYGQIDSTEGSAVYGWATSTSGATRGVYGRSTSSYDGIGVVGWAEATTGDTKGVYGESNSTDGRGVYGRATATSGITYGVYGISDSTHGAGVYGTGVITGTVGIATTTSVRSTGVYGENAATAGQGVRGYAKATTGITKGVVGISESTEGYGVLGGSPGVGVYGQNSATEGWAPGIVGQSFSSEGPGVFGFTITTSGSGFGVYGRSESTGGTGVYGVALSYSGSTSGVYGYINSPSGYGVYGRATTANANWAVFGYGNIGATGTINELQAGKNDGWHQMYAMVSPEVLFEDVGTAQLADSVAVVTIEPKFAETVNLNIPYQVFLTPRGDCGLYLAETTPASFTVRALGGARCSLAFDYRIIAKRAGYEDVRMAPASDPNLVSQASKLPQESQP